MLGRRQEEQLLWVQTEEDLLFTSLLEAMTWLLRTEFEARAITLKFCATQVNWPNGAVCTELVWGVAFDGIWVCSAP